MANIFQRIGNIQNNLPNWLVKALNLDVTHGPAQIDVGKEILSVVDVFRSAAARWTPFVIHTVVGGASFTCPPTQQIILLSWEAVNLGVGTQDVWLRIVEPASADVIVVDTFIGVPVSPASGGDIAHVLPTPIPLYPGWTVNPIASPGGATVNVNLMALQAPVGVLPPYV